VIALTHKMSAGVLPQVNMPTSRPFRSLSNSCTDLGLRSHGRCGSRQRLIDKENQQFGVTAKPRRTIAWFQLREIDRLKQQLAHEEKFRAQAVSRARAIKTARQSLTDVHTQLQIKDRTISELGQKCLGLELLCQSKDKSIAFLQTELACMRKQLDAQNLQLHQMPICPATGVQDIQKRVESLDEAMKESLASHEADACTMDLLCEKMSHLMKDNTRLLESLENQKSKCVTPEQQQNVQQHSKVKCSFQRIGNGACVPHHHHLHEKEMGTVCAVPDVGSQHPCVASIQQRSQDAFKTDIANLKSGVGLAMSRHTSPSCNVGVACM